MKKYSNQKSKPKINTVKPGDLALIKNNNKYRINYTSVWNLTPCTALKTKGNTILLKENGQTMLQQKDQVKPYYSNIIPISNHCNTDIDSDDESSFLNFLINSNTNQIQINHQTDLSDGDSSDTTMPCSLSDDETSTSRPERNRAPPKYLESYQKELTKEHTCDN